MAESLPPLLFDTDFRPDTGRPVRVAPGITRISAANAGPYTFTGTNSFLIGDSAVAVLDPGPDDTAHHAALRAAIGGRRVEAILLTHTHRDHSAGARRLAAATGAPLWFAGPHRLSRPRRPLEMNLLARDCDWGLTPDRTLADGELVDIAGIGLRAVATPGHCANHLCFAVPGAGLLLSGDHAMGWSSTLVAVPDGSMAAYLTSLEKVAALDEQRFVPAHGGPIEDGRSHALALLGHRLMRNQQILEALARGARRPGELVAAIYPALNPALRRAAAMTLNAHLEYLEATGALVLERGLFGTRVEPA